jgi:hypothetical protein
MDEQVAAAILKLAEVQEQQNTLQKQQFDLMEKKEMQTKAPAAFGTYTELHGLGSLWGRSSVERDIITAHMNPVPGLASVLPLFPSVNEDPRFGALTGYTDTSGAEPTNPCDDAPAGYVKACNLTAQFGRVQRDTQTIEWDKVSLRRNRGDFTDLMLRGQVLGMTDLSPMSAADSDILNIVTKSEMVIAAVNMERKLVQHVWQGSPANNNAGGGYKEYPGLDNQIATGQVDADSNTLCAALDSDVKDFGYDAVDGVGRDIVEYLSMLEFYLRYNATQMGLDPVSWAIVMRPELWFELSAVWPCRYLSNRCAISDGTSPIVINDNVNVTARDEMRNGRYIDINGNRYPVIVDVGIFEHTNINNANVGLGQYASSIYMVPLTITGNFPVTYREHVDYRAAFANSNTALLRGSENFWSDDGVYSWAFEDQKWCYKLSVKTEQRIILRTPQLAGRIDSILYEPLQHLREGDPTSPYWYDGGVSTVADETSYAVWK